MTPATGSAARTSPRLQVGLLTGGDDRSYAQGLTAALVEHGVAVDFVGSDAVRSPTVEAPHLVTFLNFRGDQSTQAPLTTKVRRLLLYYGRLLRYAIAAQPRVFHILWNNKFEWFDRTLLMVWYRLCRRRVVMTVHNVNAAKRDGRDTLLNRLTLSVQYRLSDHLFVHTERMRQDMLDEFSVPSDKVSVIPFGINNTTPTTSMTSDQAREQLGLAADDRVLLFFGQIAPYKGLEYLVEALSQLGTGHRWRLVIAGKVKVGCEEYGASVRSRIGELQLQDRVTAHIEHIADNHIERYFKAADVLVIPYVSIFQSGVPFLAYSFGVPVIATEVGSLRDDVVEGKTGWICRPQDPMDLAAAIRRHFDSELQRGAEAARQSIRDHANERHSWTRVAAITERVYRGVLSTGAAV